MSAKRHTKGPWKVFRRPFQQWSGPRVERTIVTEWIHPQSKDHYPIASCAITAGETKTAPWSTIVHLEEDDAKLLASAPELYEALELIAATSTEPEVIRIAAEALSLVEKK